MKLVSTLSAAAIAGALILSLVFQDHATAFYGVAVSAAIVLIAAVDYAPKTRRWQPCHLAPRHTAPRRSKQNLRLAA